MTSICVTAQLVGHHAREAHPSPLPRCCCSIQQKHGRNGSDGPKYRKLSCQNPHEEIVVAVVCILSEHIHTQSLVSLYKVSYSQAEKPRLPWFSEAHCSKLCTQVQGTSGHQPTRCHVGVSCK